MYDVNNDINQSNHTIPKFSWQSCYMIGHYLLWRHRYYPYGSIIIDIYRKPFASWRSNFTCTFPKMTADAVFYPFEHIAEYSAQHPQISHKWHKIVFFKLLIKHFAANFDILLNSFLDMWFQYHKGLIYEDFSLYFHIKYFLTRH